MSILSYKVSSISNTNDFQTNLWAIDGALTGQSGTGSNANEKVTPHTPLL